MSANDRVRVPLAFGPGLDRATGPMVVEPGAMEDLRNVYLLDAKLQVRKGFGVVGALAAPGVPQITHVLGGHPLRSEGIGIVVGWSEPTGEVHVFRTEPDGSSSGHLGKWFESDETLPPIIHMAESFGRIFMAHDEPRILRRAPTFVYDPITPGDLLSPLVDTMASGESIEHYIRFRGVVQHLDYLFGWGYGTFELDRPELVRGSLPGQPRVFEEGHYWIAGDRRDPVLQCVPGASDLVVFKAGEWHAIVGYDRRTFGITLRDPLFGLLAPRLAVNVSGLVFFWSPDGPRVTDGSAQSESLEIPLDLQGFEPADLPPEGDPCEAFATYVWADRVVLFVFGRRAYALTVRVTGEWKWSYWTFPWRPLCAFTLWDTAFARGIPPVGYPEALDEDVFGTFVDLTIGNVNQEGDERLEIWMAEEGGPWSLRKSTDVHITAQQVERVTGLTAGLLYFYALRYRRGNQIHPSYQGDPSTWPAVSRGSFTTTMDPPEVGVHNATFANRFAGTGTTQFVWERTSSSSQYLQFRVTPSAATGPGQSIKLQRRIGEGGAWTDLETLVEGEDFELTQPFIYRDVDPPQGDPVFYRGITIVDSEESLPGEPLRLWPGPLPEAQKALALVPFSTSIFVEADRLSYEYRVTAHRLQPVIGVASAVFLFDNWDDAFGTSEFTAEPDQGRGTDAYGQPAEPIDQQPPDFGRTTQLLALPSGPLDTPIPSPSILQVGVVYQASRFGINDLSEMFVEFVGI